MPHFEIPCILFKQRNTAESPSFAIFSMPAGEVLEWAAIRRREDDPTGPQRRLSQAKINAIKRFFDRDVRNTIPTAVTVTLRISEDGIQRMAPDRPEFATIYVLRFNVEEGTPQVDKPGVVIDGQHRLLGMENYSRHCLVPVVALLNVDDTEKAFQFLVINNKATRVPTDHIRTLALDYQQESLAIRLQTARLTLDENLKYVGIMDRDEMSPFRGHLGLVSHEGNGEQRFVPPAAIENSIALIQKKAVRELQNDDALCDFFYAIWSPVRQAWPELWAGDSKLMHKVSIVALTTYMTDLLVAKYDYGELDIANPEAVCAMASRILEGQTRQFWESEWTIRINDSRVVQDKIVESLTHIARNSRSDQPWYEGIDMVVL
jgi:DGQHR domain-containing protein